MLLVLNSVSVISTRFWSRGYSVYKDEFMLRSIEKDFVDILMTNF